MSRKRSVGRILSHAVRNTEVFHHYFTTQEIVFSHCRGAKAIKLFEEDKTLNFTSRASLVIGRRSKIVTTSRTAAMSKTWSKQRTEKIVNFFTTKASNTLKIDSHFHQRLLHGLGWFWFLVASAAWSFQASFSTALPHAMQGSQRHDDRPTRTLNILWDAWRHTALLFICRDQRSRAHFLLRPIQTSLRYFVPSRQILNLKCNVRVRAILYVHRSIFGSMHLYSTQKKKSPCATVSK